MTSSARRVLLGIVEGSVDVCRVLSRGSTKMLKREGERVDPCDTPIVQSADVVVISPVCLVKRGSCGKVLRKINHE